MAKRFTDTEKWKDKWFRKLEPDVKVFWFYITENCDQAGYWKKDYELASFLCGFEIKEDIVEKINNGKERIVGHKEYLEIKEFISFQYGHLSKDCRPHKPIIELVKKYQNKGYQKVVVSKGVEQESKLPDWLDKTTWNDWVKYRKEKKKTLTPMTIKKQVDYLEKNKDNHIAIINQSITNGYIGLFELKQNNKKMQFGRLRDGSKVEFKFGKWVDASNPNIRLNERYFPELKTGEIISEDDWQSGKRYKK